MAPPMDSNYRDANPRKRKARTHEDLCEENGILRTEVETLRSKHQKLQHLLQDKIIQELKTGKPSFTFATDKDIFTRVGFHVITTIRTHNGDCITLEDK